MPIYRLEPIPGTRDDAAWQATYLHEGCWVLATSPDDARSQVELATLTMTDRRPGEKALFSPWRNDRLTECRVDNPALDMREGIIVTAGGRTIS